MSKRIRRVLIAFKESPQGLVPRDLALYEKAMEYCRESLAVMPEFRNYLKTHAIMEFGENQEPIACHGVSCYGMRPDIGVFRVTGPYAKRATALLYDGLNSDFADLGWRGQDVFIFISDKEAPEQRCPAWQESLEAVGAKPAQRFAVTIE